MSTELVKPSTQLASTEVPQSAWGAEGTRASDINIPRLNLMQGLSDKVKKRQAGIGDIVDSMTGEVVAPFGKGGVEVIPICMHSEWLVHEILPPEGPGKKPKEKYLRREPVGIDNEFMPYEDMENGKPIKRTKQLNFFVLGVKQVDSLPYLVSFKKSSLKTGKNLATYFRMCEMKRLPPASKVYVLGTEEETKDSNTYQILTARPGRPTTKQELETAYMWYETLKKSNVKVIEEDEPEVVTQPANNYGANSEVPF